MQPQRRRLLEELNETRWEQPLWEVWMYQPSFNPSLSVYKLLLRRPGLEENVILGLLCRLPYGLDL